MLATRSLLLRTSRVFSRHYLHSPTTPPELPLSSVRPAAFPFVASFTFQHAPFSTSDNDCKTEVTKLNNLGWKYHNGIGVEQSDDKAKEYYARAIEIDKTALEPKQNLTFLEDQETKIKEQGYTIRRNIVQWYDQERGKALGKRLEKKYKDKHFLVNDLVKARLLHANATTEDNAESQYLMGEAYRRGDGVIQSHEKAQEWYAKATPERKLNRMARETYCIFFAPNWLSATVSTTAEVIAMFGSYFMFLDTFQMDFGYNGWTQFSSIYAYLACFWYPLKAGSSYCGKELWKKKIVGIRQVTVVKSQTKCLKENPLL